MNLDVIRASKELSCTCSDFDSCTNFCILHTGYSLYNFLKNIDLIQTGIGKFSKTSSKGPTDLICCGHELYGHDTSTSQILRKIEKVVINTGDKFNKEFNKGSNYILSLYCKAAELSTEETSALMLKLENINKLKSLILPLNPKTTYNIDFHSDGVHIISSETPIFKIDWSISDDVTHTLKCKIFFKPQSGDSKDKLIAIDMVDYNKKFTTSNIEVIKKGKHDNSIIEVSEYGMIRPIEFVDGKVSVILDNTYVYSSYCDDTSIIGFWNENDKLVIDNKYNSKAIKTIENNMNIIKMHKKFIAPYRLCTSHIVNIK